MWCKHMCEVREKIPVIGVLFTLPVGYGGSHRL